MTVSGVRVLVRDQVNVEVHVCVNFRSDVPVLVHIHETCTRTVDKVMDLDRVLEMNMDTDTDMDMEINSNID
jgi:uncharacterized alkaline shock family protein YloU